ncbi:hypothetical protein HK099_006012 [Clydaea vesicula]|uniref:Uncharacterized protein n=1 Tax=Clydaea vesicula TaxID=447962 RepID=A0AAD5U0T0_9FUNG|nr:hypothetical protein HK099_006012 [Clydaea vesicula]
MLKSILACEGGYWVYTPCTKNTSCKRHRNTVYCDHIKKKKQYDAWGYEDGEESDAENNDFDDEDWIAENDDFDDEMENGKEKNWRDTRKKWNSDENEDSDNEFEEWEFERPGNDNENEDPEEIENGTAEEENVDPKPKSDSSEPEKPNEGVLAKTTQTSKPTDVKTESTPIASTTNSDVDFCINPPVSKVPSYTATLQKCFKVCCSMELNPGLKNSCNRQCQILDDAAFRAQVWGQ